jgi:uncharacterized protein (DUF849 family)
MIPTKAMTPYVPVSVAEIVEQVCEAAELGITLVHLHARDEASGEPAWQPELYARIMEGIRKYWPALPLCLSLSGRNFNEFEKRSAAIELKPDMGSLTLGSLNFPRQASINAPDMIVRLAEKMHLYGVHPELEVFDLGMIHYGRYLIGKSILRPPFYWNIIAGNVAGLQDSPTELGLAVSLLPAGSYWAFGGIGRQQLSANTQAIASGGGVRTGLEDNIYFDNTRLTLATNIDLLRRIHALARIHDRAVMPPAEFGAAGFYNDTMQKRS